MQDVENNAEVAQDPIVATLFECRRSLKADFWKAAKSDGHETFSAGLRQIMYRYVRRWKARSERQMLNQELPGAGENSVPQAAPLPGALGGGVRDCGTVTGPPTIDGDGRSAPEGPVGGVAGHEQR